MRFFQPLLQYGFTRLLAETRTRTHLSPGIIAIEKPDEQKGYSAFFNTILPPSYSSLKEPFTLNWIIPENKKEKALTNSFNLPFQPFYSATVNSELSERDFETYTNNFLGLEDIEKQIYILPIDFIESSYLDLVLKSDVSFITLLGLNRIFNNQRKLAYTLVNLKEKIPPDIAIYLSGAVSPAYFSFLIYLGIDFFDNSLAYKISKNGYFAQEDKLYPINNHPRCFCRYCSEKDPDLLGHNELVMKNEIAKIRFALEEGTIRELVEKDIHRSVTFAATLKHLDKNYSDSFSQRTPVISSSKLKCIGEESLYNPSILEYRQRIRTRFKPQMYKKIILLLPCSAKKPYSFSRSHIQFRTAIKKAGKRVFSALSEIIITSPLSVVPRELENIYPPRFYDIPVAGIWSEEEISITSELLLDVLSQFPKESIIINHMHGHGYEQIIENIREKSSLEIIDTSAEKSPTSPESLKKLSEVLTSINPRLGAHEINSTPSRISNLKTVADYQFGNDTGDILFSNNIKIKGKYPKNLQVFRDKRLIATVSSKTGFLSILPDVAQEIVDKTLVKLEFGAEYVSGSNIYAPGCIHADENIHPDDEIFIINNNQVIATARALVSGLDMNKMTSGSLAEVKKKLKVKR